MDLDNIKSKWNELEINPTISEDKIQKMVDNEGKGALSKLIRMEKIFILTSVLCLGFPFLFNWIFASMRPLPHLFTIIYLTFCVIAIFSQTYKIRHLKSIDLNQADILTCSKKILKYRMYINYELFAGLIFAVLMMSIFTYDMMEIVPEKHKMFYIIFILVETLLIVLFVFIFYRKMYYKKIKQIESSLKEIDEFEKDEEFVGSKDVDIK